MMRRGDPTAAMWSDAVQMLSRAERLHREIFRPGAMGAARGCWEPPVDVLETEREVLILAALPGVDPDAVGAAIEDGELVLSGARVLPHELGTAVIHRLELPQGHFERRVPLPPGRYDAVGRTAANGCLAITLRKAR
jgi:HSP20 family molecular chaperone IbpA